MLRPMPILTIGADHTDHTDHTDHGSFVCQRKISTLSNLPDILCGNMLLMYGQCGQYGQ